MLVFMCGLQAVLANLNVMCSSQAAAHNLGATLGQAVSQAIPSGFGPSPCGLFQGTALSLKYAHKVSMQRRECTWL